MPAKELPSVWSEYLSSKPETGMGYQIVAITLADGRKIEDVAIIESHLIGEVRGCSGIPFEPDNITAIELTHRRWIFKELSDS